MEAQNRHENSTTHLPSVHQDKDTWTMSSSEGKASFNEEKLETIAVVDEKEIVNDTPYEDDSKPAFLNGEPVITTGRDVSRFVVDIRDNEDPALTCRSIVIGTIFAGMSSALSQVNFWTMPTTMLYWSSGRYTPLNRCRRRSLQSS